MTSWPDAALIEIKRGTFEGKKLDGAIAAKRLYEYVVLNGDCAGERLNECDTETTVEVPRAVISMLRDNYYRAQHDSDYPTDSLLCAVAVVLGMVKEKAEKTEEAGEA